MTPVKAIIAHRFRAAAAEPIPSTGLDKIAAALSYLVLVSGLVTIAAAIYTTVVGYNRVPFWDMWSVPTYLAHPDRPWWEWLWAQHNEHRILLPKLILLADFSWFRGRGLFALSAIIATLLAHFALLAWALWFFGRMQGREWRAAAGIIAAGLFSLSQWENFVSGFQIAFVLPGFLASLSVICLLLYGFADGIRPRPWLYLGLSVAAAAAATYSLADGILIWPVLVLVALLQRMRKSMVVVIVISGGAVIVSYLYRYRGNPGHSDPLRSLAAPFRVAAYVAKYLGAPWVETNYKLAAVFGCVALAGATVLLWRMLARRPRSGLEILLGALAIFCLGTASMTALGRLGFGTNQALSSRYEAFALLLWLCLGVSLVKWAGEHGARFLLAAEIAVLAVIAVGAIRIALPIRRARQRALQVNTASLAILTGVLDRNALAHVFPVPDYAWRDVPFLKQNHLSVFATDLAANLNQPLTATYRIGSESCWGEVESVNSVVTNSPPGLWVTGWAWDRARRRAITRVIFVADQKIVGYGEMGYPRPDLQYRLAARSAADAGWTGYIEPLPGDPTVEIYAVPTGSPHELCRVANLTVRASHPR